MKPVLESFFKKNLKILLVYAILMLLVTFSMFVGIPKYTGKILASQKFDSSIQNTVITLIIIYVFVSLLNISKRILEDQFVPNFNKEFRDYLYAKIMKSYKKDEDCEIGKLLQLQSYLPYSVRSIFLDLLKTYIPYGIASIYLIIYFFYLDVKIGCIQLITLSVFFMVFFCGSKICIEKSRQSMVDYLEINEEMKDKISNLSAIFNSNTEEDEISNYDKRNEKNTDIYKDSLTVARNMKLSGEIILLVSFAMVNFMLLKSNIPFKQKTAIFVAETFYFFKVLQELQISSVSTLINIGEVNGQLEYLDTISTNMEKEYFKKKQQQKKNKKYALKITNVSFKYDSAKQYVIQNFNMKVKKNEIIYLDAPSGSGKSTLFNLILKSLNPSSGEITIFGKNKYKDEIFMVDQRSNLFNESVIYNILYGNADRISEKQVLKMIKKLETSMLDIDLNKKVGVDGSNVSGGQRQLIILLRAYFSKASVILLDEPIASIDNENIDFILEFMKNILAKKKTLIITSHNKRIEEISDRKILLKKSRNTKKLK